MPNLIPGFIYQPISHAGRPRRRKGRGLVGHVAVSESANLRPWNANDWHAYLPKTGPGIQYIDLDYVAFTSRDGSYSLASFESQGGTGNDAKVNSEPWNDNQLRLAATFLRHLHDTEGVPLQVMPDSRPESRGFGTHRLGIDPWRVPGGESWSSSRGKLCPGDAKHAQRFDIVRLAAGGNLGDDMAAEDVKAINDWVNFRINQLAGFVRTEIRSEVVGRIAGLQELVKQLADKQGTPIDMAAVEATVEHAVAKAIDSIDTTVRFDTQPPTS